MSKKAPNGQEEQENLADELSAMLEDPEAIKAAAGKAADIVADLIRKHPYRAVGVSFAAGLITGAFFGKKNKE